MMKATVYKSTGSWYVTKTEEGQFINSRIKGVFKIDGITSTNPVAVGDSVELEPENDADETAMITGILPRKNYITRQSPGHKMQHHIVAANVDQSLMFATLREPRTSQGFIDRFLVTCEAYHVPAIIVFNKTDLYRNKEREKEKELTEVYTRIGYKVFTISVEREENLDEVTSQLKNKVTLMSGHSGVGKSSFLNKVFPSFRLKTSEVSGWSGKGMHTTTFAEMFRLDATSFVIDTPGVKELGLVDMTPQEISDYFPEMRDRRLECKYGSRCLHVTEPSCAIIQDLNSGEIARSRYDNYLSMISGSDNRK